MEFDWSDEHAAFREEFRAFLRETLPENWLDIDKHGPGSDQQVLGRG